MFSWESLRMTVLTFSRGLFKVKLSLRQGTPPSQSIAHRVQAEGLEPKYPWPPEKLIRGFVFGNFA
jgi:hypothetical protein